MPTRNPGGRVVGAFRVSHQPIVPAALADEWARDPELLFGGAPWTPGRPARTAVVSTAAGDLFAKHIRRPRARACLDRLVGRRSSARRAFEISRRLEESGVAAARALALLERSDGTESIVVYRRIEGPNLREWLLGPGVSTASRTALWPRLGRTAAALHAAAVRQRDLKAPNILVRSEADGEAQPVLVDLEGMSLSRGSPSAGARIRDLARLRVSLRETAVRDAGVGDESWHALLEAYLAEAPRDLERQRFEEETLLWAVRKETRNRARARPIQ